MTLPVFDPPAFEFARPFWDAIDDGRLALPRCSVCERWQWYPEASGTDCAGGSLDWTDVPTTGSVHSFTEVHRSFMPGGREHVPYIVALIDLDEVTGGGGPRLVANLADVDGVVWAVGRRVRATFPSLGTRTHLVFEPEGESP